ncbi:MAG: response regulator transcription factor [Gammaproteobacteria bacterium]
MHILIVDDHKLFIDGIRHILNSLDSDVDVLEATSADEAMRHLSSSVSLDLVLLDLHMPGLGGRSIMQHPRIQDDCLPIVIISGEEDPRTIKSVIDAGVMGFIPKAYSGEHLLNALRSVINGEIYIPQSIRNQLYKLPRHRLNKRNDGDAINNSGLTRRQHEVLLLIASGHSNKQISSVLFLTENTVKAHVSAILRALGASNRTECVSIARSKGLIR